MYTTAEENYIKAIYHQQQSGENVLTNHLAAALQTKPASVTDMLKKLEAKELLTYKKYYGVQLTKEGEKLALTIVRRHRLWEYFLVNHLQFGWDEVHDIAEQLEHVQSQQLADKLDVFLGHPQFDPHGDPIPDKGGKMAVQEQVNLLDLPLNQTAEICAVGSQSAQLLEMLKQKGLNIGARLEVKQHHAFDQSLEIKLAGKPVFNISGQVAGQLFVKKG
jgi:DtxR family Mn-dependent transcriptional regulator